MKNNITSMVGIFFCYLIKIYLSVKNHKNAFLIRLVDHQRIQTTKPI